MKFNLFKISLIYEIEFMLKLPKFIKFNLFKICQIYKIYCINLNEWNSEICQWKYFEEFFVTSMNKTNGVTLNYVIKFFSKYFKSKKSFLKSLKFLKKF